MPIGYPPVIDEGGFCITTLALYNNIVICNIGKNFCITSVPSILQITLICQHKPPPTPVTPDPQIGVWFLNGIQISSNNGFGLPAAPSSFTFTEQGRRLTITNLISGNYTCMLTNIAGSDVATTFIDCGKLSSLTMIILTCWCIHSASASYASIS